MLQKTCWRVFGQGQNHLALQWNKWRHQLSFTLLCTTHYGNAINIYIQSTALQSTTSAMTPIVQHVKSSMSWDLIYFWLWRAILVFCVMKHIYKDESKSKVNLPLQALQSTVSGTTYSVVTSQCQDWWVMCLKIIFKDCSTAFDLYCCRNASYNLLFVVRRR